MGRMYCQITMNEDLFSPLLKMIIFFTTSHWMEILLDLVQVVFIATSTWLEIISLYQGRI